MQNTFVKAVGSKTGEQNIQNLIKQLNSKGLIGRELRPPLVELLIFLGLLSTTEMVIQINTQHDSGLGGSFLIGKLQEYLQKYSITSATYQYGFEINLISN